MSLTRRIKALRAHKGYKQEDCSEAIGITLRTYNKKENGKSEFTLGELEKLAVFLGTTVSELTSANELFKMNSCQG